MRTRKALMLVLAAALPAGCSYRPEKPAPVVVSCHGTDPFDVAGHHVGEWKKLAENHGCILVCPKLTSSDGIFGSGSIGQLLQDEQLIMTVIGQLHYLYNIDRKNMMITGFSGGGFPVYFVGLRHPELFSAVVARSCNFNEHALDGWYPPEARSTAVMVYYGQNDPGAIRIQSVAMKFWLDHWNGTPPPFRPIHYPGGLYNDRP